MAILVSHIVERLESLGNREQAVHAQGFFKTGQGQYGEGDQFLGIRVPVLRQCVREYRQVGFEETLALLQSPWHEARLLALLLWVDQYGRGDASGKTAIYQAYLEELGQINNWDLVDASAEHIVGAHLLDRDRTPLHRLVRSNNLWARRIGIMATFHFIKRGDFAETLSIARRLLHDREDLIHKAVGWMLREIGKRNLLAEREFLDRHGLEMPRTMLRYAIERFPEPERQAYLRGTLERRPHPNSPSKT